MKSGKKQEPAKESAAPSSAQGLNPAAWLRDLMSGDTVRTVFYAVLIAMGVRIFLFEPFNIPSGSMYPTLMVGDYLFVSKYSYGYSRYSFPFAIIPFEGRIWEDPVERGDVAVFRNPEDVDTDYIKRIVGLPGDRIEVKEGILHINGTAVERERIEDYSYWREYRSCATRDRNGECEIRSEEVTVPQYLETLPNGRMHRIIEEQGDKGPSDNTSEFVVPDGHYFAMGDNRDNSADSRAIGPVPAENFIGRAEIIFFSWGVSGEPFVRFGRLFNGIE